MLWKQIRDAAGTFFNLGVGGAGLRSQSGIIEARNPANNDFAPVQAGSFAVGAAKIDSLNDGVLLGLQVLSGSNNPLDFAVDKLVAETLRINGEEHTIGPTAPVSPSPGHRWLETASGVPIYGWWWVWSGVYWLSPEMRRSLPFDNAGATTRLYFECDQGLDYFFKGVLLGIFVQTTNTGSAFWSGQLERLNAANTAVGIGAALTTQSLAADTNHALSTAPNAHVDVSSTGARQFRITLTRTSTPGNAFGAATVIFNYARP